MFTCLSKLGVTAEQLAQLAEWTKTRSVSLSFQAETKCAFNRETQREEDSKTKTVTEVTQLPAAHRLLTVVSCAAPAGLLCDWFSELRE